MQNESNKEQDCVYHLKSDRNSFGFNKKKTFFNLEFTFQILA